MRGVLTSLVALGLLAASSAAAQGRVASASAPPPAAPATRKVRKPEPATVETKAETAENKETSGMSEVLAEIQQMRQLIESQSRELEAQRTLLQEQQAKIAKLEARSGATANGAEASPSETLTAQVGAMSAAQDDLGQKVKSMETDLDKTKKSVEGRLKSFGPFSFSGDIRGRYEPFFGGGSVASAAPQDRHRARVRLRINANAKFNDEFSGGFTIASGDPGDPISTNQTLTNFFTRKPILVDKAFLTYSPRWFRPLSMTVGKWGYTWYRTELTFDSDLNPEGLSEQVMWDWKNSILTHLGFVAFQLPIFEVSGGPDTAMFGGQIQTGWKLGSRMKLGAYVSYYDYRKADAIAANQTSGLGSFGTGFGGSSFSNYSGTIGTARTYASKFGIVDAILRMDVNTGQAAFPLMLQFNYAQNTKACGNLQAFVDAEATVPFCDPRQRHAYWAEVQYGKTQEQRDMRFGYTFMRIERDAVLGAFNFSDLRQATNDVNHRIEFAYQAYKNITLGWTTLIGRQLRTPTSTTTEAPEERWLKRFQFDVFYKF